MHAIAVVTLCMLLACYVWADLTRLLIAWYSGADSEISSRDRWWIGAQTVVGLAAGTTALLTM